MHFGETCYSNTKIPDAPGKPNELYSMREAIRMRLPCRLAPWWISPQRHNIFYSIVAQLLENAAKFVARVSDTRQMAHGFEPEVVLEFARPRESPLAR
jgi:hypothetical protein